MYNYPANLADGSVLSMTTATGTVTFTTAAERWSWPLIGYAVYVAQSSPDGVVTDIEPVVLDEDRYPVMLRDYLGDRSTQGLSVVVQPGGAS